MKINNKMNDAAIMDKEENSIFLNKTNNYKYPKMITILPVFAMLVVILISIINHASGIDITKQAIITIVLTGGITLYIQLNAEGILGKIHSKTIIFLSYLSALILLLVVPDPEMISFWMLGGLVVSMLVDNKLGLFIQFNMAFIMGITLNIEIKMVLQNLIICVLMSILADALKSKTTIIYASIIILSVNITLSYLINNFIFDKIIDINYYISLFSILVVLATSFLIAILYQRMVNKGGMKAPSSQNETASTVTVFNRLTSDEAASTLRINEFIEDSNDSKKNQESKASYEVLCNMDNVLLKNLEQFSENVYLHSVWIADLSSRAAMEIGANELLAKAGGLYHEIGKMNGKQYIEEGLKLADEYAFPKELKAIIKEHNIKFDKPNSVEAAIVMLSDNVVSTIEYIEKTDDHKFTNNKIIENIFQMRLEKGTFDFSGFSLTDYKTLKEFYQKEFRNTKEKQ